MTTTAPKPPRWTPEAAQKAFEGRYFINADKDSGVLTLKGAPNIWKGTRGPKKQTLARPDVLYYVQTAIQPAQSVRVAGTSANIMALLTAAGRSNLINTWNQGQAFVIGLQNFGDPQVEAFFEEEQAARKLASAAAKQKSEAARVLRSWDVYAVEGAEKKKPVKTPRKSPRAAVDAAEYFQKRVADLKAGQSFDITKLTPEGKDAKLVKKLPGGKSQKIQVANLPLYANIKNEAQVRIALQLLGYTGAEAESLVTAWKRTAAQRAGLTTTTAAAAPLPRPTTPTSAPLPQRPTTPISASAPLPTVGLPTSPREKPIKF